MTLVCSDLLAAFLPELILSPNAALRIPPGISVTYGKVTSPQTAGLDPSTTEAKAQTADASRPSRAASTKSGGKMDEILLMLYRGLTNKEIAERFSVTPRTVKGYLAELFARFDVSNRTELVGVAVDCGLIKIAG